MYEATVNDFPFVADLAKAERKEVRSVWSELDRIADAVELHGVVLPQTFVADLLSVSRTRVAQLIDTGRLDAVEISGRRFVTEKSLRRWASSIHKNGRPFKISKADMLEGLGKVPGEILSSKKLSK